MENCITISDFAESRNVKADTVLAYIRKNAAIKSAVVRIGNKSAIDTDSEGFKLLDKKYPLPKPVQLVEGVPKEEYDALQSRYAKALDMVGKLQERQMQLLEANANQQLLLAESQQEQLRHQQDLAELHKEIERLKNRSFWDRLINR